MLPISLTLNGSVATAGSEFPENEAKFGVIMKDNQQKNRLTLTVTEVANLLGLSHAATYEAVRIGQIPSIRIGPRIIIPRVALERMLGEADRNEAGSVGSSASIPSF
ncbi:helix-turn-helix domain-containing protein [Chloroflexota bacterium]